MELATSLLNLAAAVISLLAVVIGLSLINDYRGKVQPRLANEEFLMGLLRSADGRRLLIQFCEQDWTNQTSKSVVRRRITIKRKSLEDSEHGRE